jgi:uncharacterized RDD family membrane protein YckC
MAEPVISSRRRRLCAFMIDHVIMSSLGVNGVLLAVGRHWDMAGPEQAMSVLLPGLAIIMIVYVMKDSVRGISPGRFFLGIAVRDSSDPGQCPGILRLTLRNLFIAIWPVEFFVLAFSRQKRRLGDRFARTVVIRHDVLPVWKRRLAFAGFAVVFCVLFLAGISLSIRNSAAYDFATAHIESSPEIEEQIGEIVGYSWFPTGKVSTRNGYGEAVLKIRVNGVKGSLVAGIAMYKEPGGEWQLKVEETAQ